MEEIGSGIFGQSPEPTTFYGAFLDSSSKKSPQSNYLNDFRREQQLKIEDMLSSPVGTPPKSNQNFDDTAITVN